MPRALLCYPKLRSHLSNQLLKLLLAFFLAIGVDIPRDAFAIDGRRISPFPHVLADLVYRTCSALAIFGLVRLKFHDFRLVRTVRGFLSFTVFIVTGSVRIAHIRAEDCADCLVNFLGCISLHLLGAMCVHVECGLDAFVPYGARQSLDVHTVVECV